MDQPGQRSGSGTTAKLSMMMFLQFFVWGAWFVTLGPYMGTLGFQGGQIANAYTVAPVAAILAPVLLGIVADRFFASQVVMGVLHVVGGGLLLVAPSTLNAGGSPWLFIGVLLAHMLCYMPTLGLSNTVAFNSMTSPDKQFPIVRVWGTIGWIVAGVLIAFTARWLHPLERFLAPSLTLEAYEIAKAAIAGAQAVPNETLTLVTQTDEAVRGARNGDPQFFYLAGGAGILLGFFSFLLPSTPAPMKGKPVRIGALLGLDALSMLKERNFLVFIVSSMLICIPLAAYYQQAAEFARQAGVVDVPFKMTFGQMSEIFFMLVMPLCFFRFGVKWMLAVGMLAWVVRYALFGLAWAGPEGQHLIVLVLGGIILHGICYDFFFVTGQIYTEQRAPKRIRAQSQGFLVLVTQGVGMLIGNQVFGLLVDHYTADGVTDWRIVWMYPATFALIVLIAFIFLFKRERFDPAATPEVPAPTPGGPEQPPVPA
jgi:MFS family permease